MTIIRMLGIDPSLTHTGWSVSDVCTETLQIVRVLDMGTVVTAPSKVKQVRKSSDDMHRARLIASKLREVVKQYDIKVGSAEIPSGGQSASAAKAFGIAIGILASLTIPLIEVSPREVKVSTCGSATADKEDIVRWAVELTKRCGGHELWKTSRRANDWQITLATEFVTKTEEHQADSLAGTHAAVKSQQFHQLAAMFNSLLAA
jgi:Holliday junction resolvasome RuvABC endonuclease subunit